MSDETSVRLGLPLLQAGQAQKELSHNEALTRIDLMLHGAVEAVGLNTPPTSPAAGACWIIGAAPTGAWTGRAQHLAGWTEGGWRFVAPREGMQLRDTVTRGFACYESGIWSVGQVRGNRILVDGTAVVGPRGPAIADPAGGTTADTEARATIGAILATLRTHGLISV